MEAKPRDYPKIKDLVRRDFREISMKDLAEKATNRLILDTYLNDTNVSIKPKKPSIISSCMGQIRRILLTIPKYALEGNNNPIWEVYKDLILKLPKHTKFLILTHSSIRPQLEKWITSNKITARVEFGEIPDYIHFSVWAEDGYAVVKETSNNKIFFVEPYSFTRYGDSLLADFAANLTDLNNSQAPLYFQGGNLLIGDDFFMIGADYPANTLKYFGNVLMPDPGETKEKMVYRLYKEYLDKKRTLIYVGSTINVPTQSKKAFMLNGEQWTEHLYLGNHPGTVQPLFHIDMFITPVGRDSKKKFQLLVGDPAMAAKMMNKPVSEFAMVEVFDNIAKNLEKLGFKVIRNPLPLVYVDDSEYKERYWYFATANNALVEIGPKNKKAWIPTYAHGNWAELSITDEKNKQIFESLGFEVFKLGNFHPFAENLGAVHCIKKYLDRTNSKS